jgi:hypothetical protein
MMIYHYRDYSTDTRLASKNKQERNEEAIYLNNKKLKRKRALKKREGDIYVIIDNMDNKYGT